MKSDISQSWRIFIKKFLTKNTNAISYEIRYITELENIYQKIPLCLRFTDAEAYFIEENEKKYLVFALAENNKEEILEPYKKIKKKLKNGLKNR